MPDAASPSPHIEVTGVVKDYRGLRPLRIRHLVVADRERLAISGLDAAAAEVFVNLVNGAMLPDEGEVRVFGTRTADIQSHGDWFAFLDRLGIVTPRAVLLDALPVRQNLALPFTLEIEALGADMLDRVHALAAEVGVAPAMLDAAVSEVPRHVRTRVHLARALARQPQVLLMEHPTADVEREAVAGLAETVGRVADARGLTLVSVTEDGAFADRVAGRAVRLQPGTGTLVNARGWRRWL